MDFRQWYAIFVMTGQEEKVRALIEAKLSEHEDIQAQFFVPRRLVRERKDGVVPEENKIMFPGYVLVGTETIEQVFSFAGRIKGVLKFLKNEDGFQEVRLEEISRLIYMADEDDVIGESEVRLDENDRIVVLSGPLKGEEGNIVKFNRRKSRVAVEFWVGAERFEIWLGVRVTEGII